MDRMDDSSDAVVDDVGFRHDNNSKIKYARTFMWVINECM
jgi:hypothetical protein